MIHKNSALERSVKIFYLRAYLKRYNEKVSFNWNTCQAIVNDIRWQQHKDGECIGALQWGATGYENYHSQEYLYAYQLDLGFNAKSPYRFKAFRIEGKCKTTPVTQSPSPWNGMERRTIVLWKKIEKQQQVTHSSNHTNDKNENWKGYRINWIYEKAYFVYMWGRQTGEIIKCQCPTVN